MKLKRTGIIKDNRYSVNLKVQELGSSTLTAEQEQQIIDDYAPKFKISDIVFTGKYKIDTDGKIVKDESTGEELNLSTINRTVSIDELLSLDFTIHIDEIGANEIGTIFKDEHLVCRAKCQLFEDKIVDKINSILKEYKTQLNDFEEEKIIITD